MEFRLLGPLEVWHDGRNLPVRGSKQRAPLAKSCC
jgi:DNA-binding SARP family transcriptional activator